MKRIVTKSVRRFLTEVIPEYYLITVDDGVLTEEELTLSQFKNLIQDMSVVHKIDQNNIIYGDFDFKDYIPDSFKKKVESSCPKTLTINKDSKKVNINFYLYGKLDHCQDVLIEGLYNYLNNEFNKLYKNLGNIVKVSPKKITFVDDYFDIKKFNLYQDFCHRMYRVRNQSPTSWCNDDLDLILYIITDLDLDAHDRKEEIERIIEKRIEKGQYER